MNTKDLDKQTFLSHLRIEMQRDPFNKYEVLNEADGRLPDLDIYQKIFHDYLKNDFANDLGFVISCNPEPIYHTIDLSKGDGKLIAHPFVRYIFIRIRITMTNDSGHKSEYDVTNSHYDDRTNDPDFKMSKDVADFYNITEDEYRKPCVCLYLKCTCRNNSEAKTFLSFDFAHELTHAYDEYCRYGNRAKSFKDTKIYHRYANIFNMDFDGKGGDTKKKFANFLYKTVKPEQNAVNGQFKEEILRKMDETPEVGNDHINYVWNIIRSTEVWQKLEDVTDTEKMIVNETDPENRQKYITMFDEIVGKKFRTYDGLIKYVTKQVGDFRTHVMRHAAEFANEILRKYNKSPFEGFINLGNDYLVEYKDTKHLGLTKLK